MSRVCDLHHSSWHHWILNPLSKARDRTESSWILVGTPHSACFDFWCSNVLIGCLIVVNEDTPNCSLVWHFKLAMMWSHLLFQPYLPSSQPRTCHQYSLCLELPTLIHSQAVAHYSSQLQGYFPLLSYFHSFLMLIPLFESDCSSP